MAAPGDAEGMGWKSTVTAGSYDLQSGELYFDAWQRAILAYDQDAEWTCVWQPERTIVVSSNTIWNTGDEKNIVHTGTSGITVTLATTVGEIAPGTVVRVAWHPSGPASGSILVSCGQTVSVSISPGTGREFVFYVDGSTGRWLAC